MIGRDFSYALATRGCRNGRRAAARQRWNGLPRPTSCLCKGLPPQSEYRFKHALIQDAAYENLLKSRRQLLHRRVAEILRDRSPTAALPSQKYWRTTSRKRALTDAAIEWWGKAGDQALRRSAFQEAISHLGKAIEMADRIEATGSRAAAGSIQKGQRISLQTSYARAVMWSRGFGSAETKSAFSRAQALAVDSDSPDERFNIHYGLWFVSLARGELAFARETSESFRHDAERYGRKTETAVAHRFLALTCLCQGDLAEAQAQCEEALRIYDPRARPRG